MESLKNTKKIGMRINFNLLPTMIYNILLHRIIKRTALLVFLLIANLFLSRAQDSLRIKGIILTDNNLPVSNVSINIEGSYQVPVVTNENGEFTLKSPSGEVWLVVSPTGNFKVKRVYLNNRTDLKITLTSLDIASGDDRLTIQNQQVQRRNMVSSYSQLNVDNIHHSLSTSIDQYMAGMVSGVSVTSGSGMPASAAVVNLRGVRSINTNNQPLYIVDGIPTIPQGIFNSSLAGYDYNQLTAVNPFDISKVTIVKDPAANASYGTNGSNGIILIETLDPRATQTTIDLDYRTAVSFSPSTFIPQLNGEQHKTLMQEVLNTSGMIEEDIKTTYPTLFLIKGDKEYIDYQHNTNWQDIIFKNAISNNINLNIKGGDEIARYGLSFGYINTKGIIKTTGFEGYNLRFVGRLNISKWLKMNAGVALNYGSSQLKEAATVPETSPIMASLSKSPLLNPYQYDLDGNMITALAETDAIGVSNPLAIISNYTAENHNYNFVAAADFDAIINKNLSVKTKFGLTYNVLKEAIFMPHHGMETYYDGEVINVSKGSNNDIQTFYNNSYIAFNKVLGTRHYFSSNTGVNIQSSKYQFDWGLAKNANENDKYRALQNGSDNLRQIGGQNRKWNWFSAYENLNYSYKDKYLFSGSLSLDMSSRIGQNAINTISLAGVPFGFFYSGGFAWRLSNESFLKNKSWLEDLKVRLTAGKTGNSDIGESSATNYYKAIKFRETVGLYPAVIPNDKLSFETVSQIDLGIDVSLWGNRLTSNFDVYKSNTDNLLIYAPADAFLGYDLRAENGGKLSNKGWEFNTFFRFIEKKSFKWDVIINISSLKNEITAIKGDKIITTINGAEIVNMVGAPVNSFYGYIFKGVYSTQAEASAANLVNNKNIRFKAGDAKFEDISGPNGKPDGVINDYDKTAIGSSLPKYTGGIINNFTYKRWGLSTFLQFVSGNDLFNYVRFKNEQMTDLRNQSQSVLNRWQYDGQITDVPRALWNDPIGNSSFSTRWIEDGSFLRVKNVTLSYKIPDKFLVFRNGEFYISVINILTFSKYLGYDPEFAYSFLQANHGIDYGQTPQPRQFIAGIKIGL